jgi:hypothetical protein
VKRGAYCYDSGENISNDIKTPNVLAELVASNSKVSKTLSLIVFAASKRAMMFTTLVV